MTLPATRDDPEPAPLLQIQDPYSDWRRGEGAPLVGGVYLPDVKQVEVGPWPRKGDGVRGALCYLDGDDENDEHLVELPPGGATSPQRHLYTELVYVLWGRGSTTAWLEPGHEQTFEWGPGSLYALPTNINYRVFNSSLSQSARYLTFTDLPRLLRSWLDEGFIFDNAYSFRDRFSAEAGYFSSDGRVWRGRIWESNFIPDLAKLPLFGWGSRGGGGSTAGLILGGGKSYCHVSSYQPGSYKKGHTHGPGARIFILQGEGYVLTQRGSEPRVRCDWGPGSLYLSGAGPGQWLHQHFNAGSTPAAYLAVTGRISRRYAASRWETDETTLLRGGSEVSTEEGGKQVEYANEDPEVHHIFEEELRKRGLTCRMRAMSPYCTGEHGHADERVHFSRA